MHLWLVFLRREASALRQLHLEANNPSHPRRFVTVDKENPGWPEPNPGLGRVSRGGLKNCSSTPVTRLRAECPRLASTNMPRCRAPADFPPSWTRFCSGKAVGAGLSMPSSPHLPRKQVCKPASRRGECPAADTHKVYYTAEHRSFACAWPVLNSLPLSSVSPAVSPPQLY